MTSLEFPEKSQAQLVLVFGIVGIFFALFAPVAWYLGDQELYAIDDALRSPERRGMASAGRILGIVGTVYFVLLLIAVALIVVMIGIGCSDNPCF